MFSYIHWVFNIVKGQSFVLCAFRPNYISPLDDLAFDMYQDPEIAQIIRKLERKKQEAVLRMWLCLTQ